MEPLRLITQAESWSKEVHEDVVKVLRDALARAEAGEITGVALAMTSVDECTVTYFSKREASALMLGAVVRLQDALLRNDSRTT